MPKIFDNINEELLSFVKQNLKESQKSDICVGYFNLAGWNQLANSIEHYQGNENHQARILVGMNKLPHEMMRHFKESELTDNAHNKKIDNNQALQIKSELISQFREQLTFGIPNAPDSLSLKQLITDLKSKKVVIKLFVEHPLHAKLYLFFNQNSTNTPIVGCLGSSNLTFSGLVKQGELNIDVLDGDACQKLSNWFLKVWENKFSYDISDDLIEMIENSWVNENAATPYEIYLKIIYHLSYEARLSSIDKTSLDFLEHEKLFEYQKSAVKMLVRYIEKRGGALLGDVVGLGKTLMAVAVAKTLNIKHGYETLIICPPNLVPMWENYQEKYQLFCKIISVSNVKNELPERRYRLVIIDESHNLRNKEAKRYIAIKDYLDRNESKVLLLSATPYNKHYEDLANQLALFINETEQDLGIRPEQIIRRDYKNNERKFCTSNHLSSVRTLAAFRTSEYPEDWQNLMRLYMVRRTRSFIIKNYAQFDENNQRSYIPLLDKKLYFPTRRPMTIKLESDDKNQFTMLHSEVVVSVIENLRLARYNLGGYKNPKAKIKNEDDNKILNDLSKSNSRLIGFCRTNLFKRLESSGSSFIQSIKSHILRNYIFMYAIDYSKDLPIGTLDSKLLPNNYDNLNYQNIQDILKQCYDKFKNAGSRYRWINCKYFDLNILREELEQDSNALKSILEQVGDWDADHDEKLNKLINLVNNNHSQDKILIFTQFSDTANYLNQQFNLRGVNHYACVTGETDDVSEFTYRFSPVSNQYTINSQQSELRVLIATDVLSEGQNLQDCSIIVNYDLPWAIIRLIQRAGRVDRIGQLSEEIKCYVFLPAEGVENIINLRARVNQRLSQNQSVVGTDEQFFEDQDNQELRDLYHEKANILNDEIDQDVDLSSYAYSIWKEALDKNPNYEQTIPNLPLLSHATKNHSLHCKKDYKLDGDSLIVFCKTHYDGDFLAWVNESGASISESPFEILNALQCAPDTPSLSQSKKHYELFQKAFDYIHDSCQAFSTQGMLGNKRSVRYQIYYFCRDIGQSNLFKAGFHLSHQEEQALKLATEIIYNYPLHTMAEHYLRSLIQQNYHKQEEHVLLRAILNLYYDRQLCRVPEKTFEGHKKVNSVICGMGLR